MPRAKTYAELTGQRCGNAFPHFLTRDARRAAFLQVLGVGSADRKSAGTSGVLEMPVIIGEPSGIRTLDPLIKSWERQSASTLILSSTSMPFLSRRILRNHHSLAMS